MHIAEIAPLAESVPPKLYGGTERVVHWLTEELITLGDKVTLFASGGSTSRAEVVPVCPKPLRLGRPPIDPTAAISCLLESVAQRANEFDVIHYAAVQVRAESKRRWWALVTIPQWRSLGRTSNPPNRDKHRPLETPPAR
jgi:Glycosyltransferase Family 4